MHLLVANASVRCAVVIQGSATVLDLKEKVAAQTRKGNKIEWPVEQQELRKGGEILADEITLEEQFINDRDRLELRRVGITDEDRAAEAAAQKALDEQAARVRLAAAKQDKNGGHVLGGSAPVPPPGRGGGGGGGGQAARDAVLKQLLSAAEILANHEKKVVARVRVHDEYFTQLLERLDGITLDAVDEADRDELRSKRKALIQRVEQVSALSNKC